MLTAIEFKHYFQRQSTSFDQRCSSPVEPQTMFDNNISSQNLQNIELVSIAVDLRRRDAHVAAL